MEGDLTASPGVFTSGARMTIFFDCRRPLNPPYGLLPCLPLPGPFLMAWQDGREDKKKGAAVKRAPDSKLLNCNFNIYCFNRADKS